MAKGLLEQMFSEKQISRLDKKQTHYHLTYLQEIIAQERVKKKKIKFLQWRARVVWHLIALSRKGKMS